jgi:hypothetical protein
MDTQRVKFELIILEDDMPLLQNDLKMFNTVMASFPPLERDENEQVVQKYKEHLWKKYGKRAQERLGNK